VIAAKGEAAETVALTGHIRADDEPSFAFRLGGRVIERPVNVGARLEAGQVLAKLDPENELSALRSAEAASTAARGQLNYARSDFERQRQLLANGHTPRARFDQADKALQNAQSQVDNTEAQLAIARDRVSWTTLSADAPGRVWAQNRARSCKPDRWLFASPGKAGVTRSSTCQRNCCARRRASRKLR
jgi:multidrug efflux pump subunit AcrA (membrane-fusion protein)